MTPVIAMPLRTVIFGLALCILLSIIPVDRSCYGLESPDESKGLTRVAAGTLAEDSEAARWNAVVLLAKPKISSGDVSSLSRSIQKTVSSFVLTILATVEPATDSSSNEPKFRLKEVGVGYSMDVAGQLQVVTLDQYAEMGLRLGFIQRQMLSENEKQLATVQVIAQTSTLCMFDVPGILLRDNKHVAMTIRHFVWIDARTGKNAALVWLLQDDGRGGLAVVDESPRWIPRGMKENRAIHVDGNEFVLGFPTERAFALEGLPPGKEIAWTERAKALSSETSYTTPALRGLVAALSESLKLAKAATQQSSSDP